MKKTIITFVLLAMVALVPAVSFASENPNSQVKYLKNVSWGESYHDFSLKYPVKPLLETCETILDEKLNLYGQEMDTKAVAYFGNDRLFMMEYSFPDKLTDEEFDKVTEAITKELGKPVTEDKYKVLGEMKGWKNDNNEVVVLSHEAIRYFSLDMVDEDNLFSIVNMEVLDVRR